jgi:hypothetical protein
MSEVDLEIRLRNILECLIEYKKNLINTYTLTSQKPSILNQLSPFLRQQCSLLTQYMINREMPENPSKHLSECLECLRVALEPWNPDISILAPHLCEMVLINSEMNISDSMIDKIIATYLPDPDVDGVPNAGRKYEQEEEVSQTQEQ